MKKILIISTGGTISSIPSSLGLVPSDTHTLLKQSLEDNESTIDSKTIMVLDSSNIQPEEWKIIAAEIFTSLEKYDGIIVAHGTDTMAYTASMISYMVQRPSKPIVFTGSQLPLNHPLTDALDNLKTAMAMAKSEVPGVFLAFDRKIIFGSRAVKVRTSSFSAFESINMKPVGQVSASGLKINTDMVNYHTEPTILNTNIDTDIFLLKLTPTTTPEIIPMLINAGIKGIVIEAYGAGGISFIRRDFVTQIRNAITKNIPIVVTSQCLYERSNFNIYEVGTKVIKSGAIEAFDMTTEAVVTKLMYALGQTNDLNDIRKIFYTPIANEISFK